MHNWIRIGTETITPSDKVFDTSQSLSMSALNGSNAAAGGEAIRKSGVLPPGSLLMFLGCDSGLDNTSGSVPGIVAAAAGVDVIGTGGFGTGGTFRDGLQYGVVGTVPGPMGRHQPGATYLEDQNDPVGVDQSESDTFYLYHVEPLLPGTN
jgi:hypothetical protein